MLFINLVLAGKGRIKMTFFLHWMTRLMIAVAGLILAVFWLVFFSARPPLTTDPVTLAGDGSTINYCELPILDGSGKRATDIPKGNTPGCGYTHFPLPILRECTEPLADGAVDIRGLWRGISGKVGHVERIEQCGDRTVVTSSGVIHDKGPNLTGGLTSNDTEGMVVFTVGDQEYCPRTSEGVTWDEGVLNYRVFGWGPIVVKRYLDGEHLIWEYADGSTTRMERLCTLPTEHIKPRPRGPRYVLFD